MSGQPPVVWRGVMVEGSKGSLEAKDEPSNFPRKQGSERRATHTCGECWEQRGPEAGHAVCTRAPPCAPGVTAPETGTGLRDLEGACSLSPRTTSSHPGPSSPARRDCPRSDHPSHVHVSRNLHPLGTQQRIQGEAGRLLGPRREVTNPRGPSYPRAPPWPSPVPSPLQDGSFREPGYSGSVGGSHADGSRSDKQ